VEKLSFSVAEIEAPLDLIMQLLVKHRLDILNIDISALLEQYLAVIRGWREQNLEIQSEFLEMASRLVYMKTVSLLPRREEESEALKKELSGQLVDYSVCRGAAANLGELYIGGEIFSREASELPVDRAYTLVHPALILAEALCDAMGKNEKRRPPPRDAFEPIVSRPVVSVTARIFTVLRALRRGKWIRLKDLYAGEGEKSGMIATFLAILELIRAGKVAVRGDEAGLIRK
jgi:segregation and condensation protein A